MEISAIADSGSTISNGAMMLAGAQSSTVLRSMPASRVRNAPGTASAGKARWSFPFWKQPPGGALAKKKCALPGKYPGLRLPGADNLVHLRDSYRTMEF